MNIKNLYDHSIRNNGVTVSLNSLELPKKGYAVALLPNEKRVILGKYTPEVVVNFIAQNKDTLRNENIFLGIWLNSKGQEDSVVYLDTVIMIENILEAIDVGVTNHQRAIYDLGQDKEIEL